MEKISSETERRKYPRVKAHIFSRPIGILSLQHPVIDISLKGIRVYSDSKYKTGALLELEILLSDTSSIICKVKVIWINELLNNAGAKYDIGLQCLNISSIDIKKLNKFLDYNDKV